VTRTARPLTPPSEAQVLRGPAEITEDEATRAVAGVYDRLRGALGVGFVPTVFRMLACHERYFVAAIDAVAPLVDGGRGQRACHGGLTVPGLWRELYAISPQRAAAAWIAARDAAPTTAFARALRDIIALADEAGAGCVAPTPADLAVDERVAREVERILGWFKIVIPTMIVEIECLRRAVAGAIR
jgi:hypothetical protein